MGDGKPKKLRRSSQPNFSCLMYPDDLKILRAKREDIGLNWDEFMRNIVEIIKPVRSVDDLVDLKRISKKELKKDGGS